jgi:hypothetical protein
MISACLAALFAAGHDSAAQAQALSPQLREFVQSKSNREAVQQAISQQIASWPPACRQISFGSKFDVVVVRPARRTAVLFLPASGRKRSKPPPAA